MGQACNLAICRLRLVDQRGGVASLGRHSERVLRLLTALGECLLPWLTALGVCLLPWPHAAEHFRRSACHENTIARAVPTKLQIAADQMVQDRIVGPPGQHSGDTNR